MSKYPFVITTDTTCDLPSSWLKEEEIIQLPLGYTIDGETYLGTDASEEMVKDFYERMRHGSMPITMQVSPEQARERFEPFLQEGQDILHLAFSSGLSGSCGSSLIAARELSELYPERRILVVDTLAASMGEGLLVWYAAGMRRQGASLDETAFWLEENRLHLCHDFTVDDLNHLYRGGRVSRMTALVGSALGIKPVLHVDNEGRLVPVGKVRGRRQSLVALVDNMERKMGSWDNSRMVMISHGDSLEDALFVQSEVTRRFGLENFMINPVGPTIGAHSGPGTIALFYLGDLR